MRIAISFLVLLLFAGTTAMAQGFRLSEEERAARAKQQIDHVVTTLGLTGDKETEVRTILTQHQEEQAAVFASFSGDRNREAMRMMRAEMRELQEMTNEKMTAVLSEEEMAKYQEILNEQRQQMRRRGGNRGGSRIN